MSDDARDRVAARIVLLDAEGAVLLLRGGDPARPGAGTWWFTPGGGVDAGETLPEAARRELHEETGLRVADVGSVIHERVTSFAFEGERYRQQEHFFLVRTSRFDPDTTGWSDIERRSVHEHRWWTVDEIRASTDPIYPEQLADLLVRLDPA